MQLAEQERALCDVLKQLYRRHGNRYTSEARRELLQTLFRSLVGFNEEWLRELFQQNTLSDKSDWSLSDSQGSFEGSEYSEQARGKRCGHIFRSGEATYRCKTCAADDTCVLCSKCFAATEHTGHQVYVSISPGNSGCCDCGDEEAWTVPLRCGIHTATARDVEAKGKNPQLPHELQEAIKTTIARAFDFLCDILSCSPEQLRLPKSEEAILQDERTSRLNSSNYSDEYDDEVNPEFALLLWNDEKHSVAEVTTQVAKACKETMQFGKNKARETDDIGRSIIMFGRDLKRLLKAAEIIERIKITVTIRSSRETFREQMCGTIIEWLTDISGCRVGPDGDILKQTICEELLRPWRQGSAATNAKIAKDGLFDHEIQEILEERAYLSQRAIHDIQIQPNGVVAVTLVDQPIAVQTAETASQDPLLDTEQVDGGMDIDALLDSSGIDLDDENGAAVREPDDPVENDEATMAGYPPPPPPPPVGPRPSSLATTSSANHSRASKENIMHIPRTPQPHAKVPRYKERHSYWTDRYNRLLTGDVPLEEDVRQRVRLDWLILYDLRLWKKARIDLRGLYIMTVVTVPQFKRILGLRFASLYPLLAQLYLIADREPDHSIVYMSLQIITTPSVTKEVVEKGNFMTNLFAILHTFLTTRQVGYPWEVNPSATLAFETGSVTNRRMYHFFMDIRHILASEYIQEMLRTDDRYVLQFLDLIRLAQGITPNVRAIGEHVEYETDTWISASLLTRELNRLCRMFSEAFPWNGGANIDAISRVMRILGRAAILNSMGADRKPGENSEITAETRFKSVKGGRDVSDLSDESYYRYVIEDTDTSSGDEKYEIVDFVVETGSLSFHHTLHYLLSWILDCSKSMPAKQVLSLLSFTKASLKGPADGLQDYPSERYLMALFDYPLRVCSWLAQMKSQMWVRNGLSLRHQMNTYRGVSQRDLAHQRDIFLLQTGLVICNPGRFLVSIVDRFGLLRFMSGNFGPQAHEEESQLVDIFEDFIHLLLVLLTERTWLMCPEEELTLKTCIRRDLIHNLCFKPLSFSDLSSRLADRYQELDEFQEILSDITIYKAPEGLNDSGTFELKPDYVSEIDPYILHYTKNQRDEAETIYRKWVSKKTGQSPEDVVVEPKVRPITMGLFKDIGNFTRTSAFATVMFNAVLISTLR